MKNISIVNVHWNNRGDEAALLALIHGLKDLYKKPNITILIKDPKSVELFPDIENVSYFHAQFKTHIWDIWLTILTFGLIGFNSILKKAVKNLRQSDLIVYGPGGSVINDRFFWRKQMEYLVPFICSKFYRVPLVIAAPSIGPFDIEKPNRIRKWLLKTPKIICVREAISQKYLEQIGIKKNVHVTIDFAFLTEIDTTINEEILNNYLELKEFLSSYKKIIGVTITDFKWHVKYSKDVELLSRIEDTFHKYIKQLAVMGYGVVFIPQLFGNQNDYHYMDQYSGDNSFTMTDSMNADFQQFIISKLYAVIGMRYHSNIFSAKMGTPFIAIAYEEKMQGFMELANLSDYSIQLADISFDKLNEKFSILEQDYETIKEKLQKGINGWRQNAERTVKLLDSVN